MNTTNFSHRLGSDRRALLRAVSVALLWGLTVWLPAAWAGRPCEERALTTEAIIKGLTMAAQTAQALDVSDAKVVVLARAGQDLSKYGLRYSHLGFAYRTDRGWRIVHKLNQCGTAVAAIYRQGLGEFFMDDPWRYEAAWEVPSVDVQQRLFELMQDDRRVLTVDEPAYSVVSYAWGRTYQQSNQWALETLAVAMEPAAVDRERAQAWLMFKGYQPTTLHLGPLTRLGGRITAANIAFDDHPFEKRFSDRIETATVDSVFRWLPRAGLAQPPVVLKLD